MIPLLLRLWWMRQRGLLRQFALSLRQPARLFGLLAVAAGIGFIVFVSLGGMEEHARAADLPRDSFALLCSMLFAMAVIGGFAQEGPRFTPADVDFLFPAPFTPRQLLFWRLLQLWPPTLLTTLFLCLAFGLRLAHPGRFLVAMALLQLTALHLQLLIAVSMTRLSDGLSRRLRGGARVLAPLLLFGGLAWLLFAVVDRGGLRGVIAPLVDSSVTRVLLFPVAACVDFVHASSPTALALALARLLAGAGGTLWILLALKVDFLEDSVATTARHARAMSLRRRGGITMDEEAASVTPRRRLSLPPVPLLFRGAGALVWKNALVMARSWQTTAPGVLIGLMVVLPGVWAAMRRDGSLNVALASLIPATIFWSNALVFDLRRDFDRLDELRVLPFRPAALVLAELLLPWLCGVLLQETLLLAIVLARPVDRELLAGAVAAMPLLMFTALVIDNLALFLFAPKGGAGVRGGASPGQALRPIAWLASVAPGAVAWFLLARAGAPPAAAIAVGAAIDLLIALLLFFLLVRLYESRAAVPT